MIEQRSTELDSKENFGEGNGGSRVTGKRNRY